MNPVPAPSLHTIRPVEASPVSAAISSTITFNKNTLVAADAPLNPLNTLADNDGAAANAVLVAVPTGATAIDLAHYFTNGTPAVLPQVRVFGAVPLPLRGKTPSGAVVIDPSHPILTNGLENQTATSQALNSDWIPLSDSDFNHLITLGSATEVEAWVDSGGGAIADTTTSRSATTTVFTRGVTHVLVLVATAGTGVTSGFVAGNFVY